jgi:hypothetical protein
VDWLFIEVVVVSGRERCAQIASDCGDQEVTGSE